MADGDRTNVELGNLKKTGNNNYKNPNTPTGNVNPGVRQQQHGPSQSSSRMCAICRESGTCSLCMERMKESGNADDDDLSPQGQEGRGFQRDDGQMGELQEIKIEPSSKPFNNGTQVGKNEKGKKADRVKLDDANERKWKYFPGKNKFFCNGRLMSAPNISFCLCCFMLIVVTFSLFIAFDGPFLAKQWSIAVPIVGCILFFFVIVSMLKTTFSDPGIIPRASPQEAEFIEKCYATNNVGRPPPRTKDVIINGQTVKVKYCFTCKMFRPPRASHCGVCDNCVDRFDHHCPFLGNCIGKRNYRNFYFFVLSLSFLSVFVLSCATAHLVLISKEKGNFLESLKESPTSAIVMIISFFGMWTVLGLTGFHSYLISVEQTTNEDIKGLFGRSATKNPFSRGNLFSNCAFVLCGPVQPSLIDPRGLVTDDFLGSLPKKVDAQGFQPSNVCHRNSMQAPQPVKSTQPSQWIDENSGRSSTTTHNSQQPLLLTSRIGQDAQLTNPTDHSRRVEMEADGLHISADGLTPTTNTANSMNYPLRPIGDVPSESLKNLYNPKEGGNSVSTSTSSFSGSDDSVGGASFANNYTPFCNDITDSGVSTSAPGAYVLQADTDGLDIDDPLSVAVSGRHLAKHSKWQKKKHAAYSGSTSKDSITDTDLSIKSAPSSNIRNVKKSSVSSHLITSSEGQNGSTRKIRDPVSWNNSQSSSIDNTTGMSFNGSVKNIVPASVHVEPANNTRRSVKKLQNTMIDSPLHLDSIT